VRRTLLSCSITQGTRRFPHETTGDQFFSEDQFESYRRLGRHEVLRTFGGPKARPSRSHGSYSIFGRQEGIGANVFVKHSEKLDRIWERLRTNAGFGATRSESS
jgi:hypothetical protein